MKVDICICTFRRGSVVETLASLAAMQVPEGTQVRVIVADNDDIPSARERVEALEDLPFKLHYIHVPARNISIARNACLERADAPLVAFVDDDELVSQGWLAAMIAELESSGASAVFGPVMAVYDEAMPEWIKGEDYHSTNPGQVGEMQGFAGNVLFKADAPEFKGRRFRLELGQTGGEDTAFFAESYEAGAKFSFATDAVATEHVPADRACFSWLVQRKFRSGQTHGMFLLERDGRVFVRLKESVLAAVKAVFCAVVAMLHVLKFFDMAGVRRWGLRGALHAGALARLLSMRELKLYG